MSISICFVVFVEDYHLEYADEVWIEDDGDWEMAVEYFDAENPDRLELTIKKNVQEEKVAAPPVKVKCFESEKKYLSYMTTFLKNIFTDKIQEKVILLQFWKDSTLSFH